MIRGRFLRCLELSSAIIYEREREERDENIMHIPENYLILSPRQREGFFAIGARAPVAKGNTKTVPYLYLYEVYTYVTVLLSS